MSRGRVGTKSWFALGVSGSAVLAVSLITAGIILNGCGKLEGELADALANVEEIVTGGDVTCARAGDKVHCWGDNSEGQLGDGTNESKSVPTTVAGLSGTITHIDAGQKHICAADGEGVKCWGNNALGQLGNGTNTDSVAPGLVTGVSGIKYLSAGAFHTCAVTTGDKVYCWGYNFFGQVGSATGKGDPNSTGITTAVEVSGLSGTITDLSAGATHTCIVIDAAVNCWGNNATGQVGAALAGASSATPQATDGSSLDTAVESVSAGGLHTCATKTDGTAYCFGNGSKGQLGDGNTTLSVTTPVQVSGLTSGVTEVTAGNLHTCAVKDLKVYCWGHNDEGQLGDESLVFDPKKGFSNLGMSLIAEIAGVIKNNDKLVPFDTNLTVKTNKNGKVKRVRAKGANHTCTILPKRINCVGKNEKGQLGLRLNRNQKKGKSVLRLVVKDPEA